MDLARIADHNAVRRHIKIDKRIRCNHHIISDRDAADDRCVDSDKNTVSDFRASCPLAGHDTADGAALVKVHVVADHNICTDRDVIGMTQINTFSDLRRIADLKPVFSRKQKEADLCQPMPRLKVSIIIRLSDIVPKQKVKRVRFHALLAGHAVIVQLICFLTHIRSLFLTPDNYPAIFLFQ